MAALPEHPGADRFVVGLDDDQAQAVTVEAHLLAVLAGAGSGKTRVLTRRIARQVHVGAHDPRHVLAITFTRRAAGELTSRLRALGLRDGCVAGTFHAVAQAQLRSWWMDRGMAPRELLDRPASLLATLLPSGGRSAARPVRPGDVAAEIAWAKARRIDPDSYVARAVEAGRRPPVPIDALAALYQRYEQTKARRRLVDFDDLLEGCVRAMERDRGFAEAQRWRFRHLYVDEFQDVNPLQLALVRAWRGDQGDLCVVGDPDQAIYGWNGADPDVLPRFSEHFPGATVVRLRTNYRATPQLLGVARAVLEAGNGRAPDLRPHRPDGPLPVVMAFPHERAEADGAARALRDRHAPGRPWSAMAVLVRTNQQATLLAARLQMAGIPHRLRGASPLLDRPGVGRWLRLLRQARSPVELATALADLEAELRPAESDEAPEPRPERGGAAGELAADLATLAALGRDFVRLDPDGSGSGLVGWLRATVASDVEAGADGVEVATFHAAKGLEWPVVVVAGLEQGLVPMAQPDADGRREEVRLLYVALTRARDELVLTWSSTRVVGGREASRSPSPLLAAIEAARVGMAPDTSRGDWAGHLARSRAVLAEAGPGPAPAPAPSTGGRDHEADDALLGALWRWRAGLAAAARVPASAVVEDRTLQAVALLRPAGPVDLADLPGLGPVKAASFGPALLALVDAHPGAAPAPAAGASE